MRDVIFVDETRIEGDDASSIGPYGPEDFMLMTELLDIIQNAYGGIQYIVKPSLYIQTVNGITTLTGSPYQTTEYWIGPHNSSKFEVSLQPDCSIPLQLGTVSTGNLTQWDVPVTLSPGTYYGRVKYFSDQESSIWSNIESFEIV